MECPAGMRFLSSKHPSGVPTCRRFFVPPLRPYSWLFFAGPALAIDPVFQDDGAAFRGYDPIAYFTEDGPVKGSPENSFSYQGAI